MLFAVAISLILAVGAGSVALTMRMQASAPQPAGSAEARQPVSAQPVSAQPVPARSVAGAASSGTGVRRAPENAVERFVVLLKRRKVTRVALSFVSFALLLGAGAMIGYPFYTNVYQDRVQSRLDRQLASPEIRDAYVSRQVGEGESLTRIVIPRIGVDVVVVEGTSASALRAGAGHYPSTPLPCEVGNVAIAGHRTTYGKPFHNLDLVEVGDRVILETPIGTCTYEVQAPGFCSGNGRRLQGDLCIVTPLDVGVVDDTPQEARLTLTTCHPKGSARERLVLTATMVSAEGFDA